jgi:hypothetical protein
VTVVRATPESDVVRGRSPADGMRAHVMELQEPPLAAAAAVS